MQKKTPDTVADKMLRAMGDIDFVLGAWSEAGHEPDHWPSGQLSTAIDEYARGRYASASSMIAVTLNRSSRSDKYNGYRQKRKALADLKRVWRIVGGSR